ncbi:MAG TPA: c-type cytochrome [Propylenella sp.]
MIRCLPKLGATLLLAVLGGLLFASSGLYNVAASAGHWPVTSWLLHFSMRQSVEMHSLMLDAPPLDDPALIERGAGHYDGGCLPCHGAPGSPGNRIPNHMLPPPPYLPTGMKGWSAEELFRIVKHGIKYTGMPAWPAPSRDDEVWAVTAFLQRLPDLSAEDYLTLAKGPRASPAEPPIPESPGELFTLSDATLIATCARCHGLDGQGRRSGAFPRLDIQSADYLERALAEYADGIRPSGIMQPIAAALEEGAMQRLAAHYAADGVSAEGGPAGADDAAGQELVDRGLQIAAIGIPERQVPPCSACHGLEDGPRNTLYPALNGQYRNFLHRQLRLWKEGKRGGSEYAGVMLAIVANLTEAEMAAAAAYYASLPPPERAAGRRRTAAGETSP